MPTFQSPIDAATLFYRYYTPSSTSPHKPSPATPPRQPLTLVFLHGWPMSSRMFDSIILPLLETHRFPILAPDRRGFGHSSSAWSNRSTPGEVTFDTFVSDLSYLLDSVNIGPFVFVAASMGCSESLLTYQSTAAPLSPQTRSNCRGFVWLGPNMPYSVRCAACPDAPDPAVWDFLIEGFRSSSRAEFIAQQVPGVFRADLNEVDGVTLRFFERIVAEADPVAVERCAVICQREMEGELRRFVNEEERKGGGRSEKLSVLIIHGNADTGMPLETSSKLVKELIPWSDLKVYGGAGHGLYITHASQVVDDILSFLEPILSLGK